MVIRPPTAIDGPAVHDLIANCPELDANSLYCNVLQCAHFSETCAVALDRDGVAGWASGYLLPGDPDTLFVWQIAVRHDARGSGIGIRLLTDILLRPRARPPTKVAATVTSDNHPSMALFEALARRLDGRLERTAGFSRGEHFGGRHPSELALSIGPFALDRLDRALKQETL